MSWDYGPLASEIYELDKPIGHSFGDVEYYTRSLSGVSGRILEPATGTGRILIPLLEAGHEVHGLDISPDMLAICRQHCRDHGLNPVLLDADMTTFVRPATYEAVIIPTGSITLLDGRKWQDGTLLATELQPFRLQHWSLHEFKEMLGEAGFTGIRVTADWQDNCAPGPGNEDWTFHATRR